MSKFVNYKKRSFTLPPGYKDLADLLHGAKPKPVSLAPVHEPKVSRGESGTIELREVSEYVADVFESQAESVILMLQPAG